MTPKNDAAKTLYKRRKLGLERKARDLIMKSFTDYNVRVQATLILEFEDEVSLFRSHLRDDEASWWHSLKDLKKACGNRLSDMGIVTSESQNLMRWQQAQQQEPQASPARANRSQTELPEDILSTAIPFDVNGGRDYRDPVSEGEGEGSSSESLYENSDDDSSSDDEDNSKSGNNVRQNTSAIAGSTKRTSPKRRREEDVIPWVPDPSQPSVFNPQYSQPNFNYNNGVNPSISNHPNNLYGTLPQSASPQIILPQAHNNLPEIYNNSYNTELGFPAAVPQSVLPHRPTGMPKVPRVKRSRSNRPGRNDSGRSRRNRTT